MQIEALFIIAVVVMSVVVHEVAHGVVANWLGDPTARLMGRLTLNPFKHLDPIGSVILPGLLAFSGAPVLFGWAKPVPYNPYNLRAGRWSEAYVALAGPASNMLLALLFGLIVRMNSGSIAIIELGFIIVTTNIMLAIFNMIPIPPLDGSKVLPSILPTGLAFQYDRFRQALEWNPFLGFGIVLGIVMLFGGVMGSVVFTIAGYITGIGL